jgi:hypothetical protein
MGDDDRVYFGDRERAGFIWLLSSGPLSGLPPA